MELEDEITELKGIGEKKAALFHKAGIYTLWDLLMFFPRDYLRYPAVKPVSALVPPEKAAVRARIASTPSILRVKGLVVLNAVAKDGTGSILLTWYNAPFLKSMLKVGTEKVFYGQAEVYRDALTIRQPQMFAPGEYEAGLGKLKPIYPLTKGLTKKAVESALSQAFSELAGLEDYLPEEDRKELDLMELGESIKVMHSPKSLEEMIRARQRLVFDEFHFFIRSVQRLKENKARMKNAYPIAEPPECKALAGSLPYELTGAQLRAYGDILKDLAGEYAMNRLIQGDVGSGKTIVALLAMVAAVKNGYQAALMAPTEVLAAQHRKKIGEMVQPLGISCILLTGAMTAKEKRLAREKIASGEAQIVIGTHALITDKVEFKSLSLAITDEQHRFGVRQRKVLMEKGSGNGTDMPHVLVMSATPIPRTLAIILYGDLDISVMDEVPAMRLPIKNCVVGKERRPKAYRFILDQVREGHQAYVICPKVEESEGGSLCGTERENVEDYGKKLAEILGSEAKVGILHGRMKPKEKDRVMEDFSEGRLDVLVSTTVVEVGVDVPNATVMLIENAECFGLSQLHQLRGRIGRGDAQSYCMFIDTSESRQKEGKPCKRLMVMDETNDGFKIASEDLKLRGPGDLFGIRQSGDFTFRLGDVYTDAGILKKASEYATKSGNKAGEGYYRHEKLYDAALL